MKQRVRLTESELHALIENTVKQVLSESDMDEGLGDFVKGAWNKISGDASNKARQSYQNGKERMNQAGDSVKQSYNKGKERMSNLGRSIKQGYENGKQKLNQFGQNVKQGVRNAADSVSQYASDVKAAGQHASNVADAQKAIKTINDLMERGILGPKVARMVIGSLKKYGNK